MEKTKIVKETIEEAQKLLNEGYQLDTIWFVLTPPKPKKTIPGR